MDANITLVQSFGPPVTKSLREPVRLPYGYSASCKSSSPTAAWADPLPIEFPGGWDGIHAASGAHTVHPPGKAVIKGNKPLSCTLQMRYS